MDTVGRELIMHLCETPEIAWARAIVSDGRARWAGGKPHGLERPVALVAGPTVADTVLEDRR